MLLPHLGQLIQAKPFPHWGHGENAWRSRETKPQPQRQEATRSKANSQPSHWCVPKSLSCNSLAKGMRWKVSRCRSNSKPPPSKRGCDPMVTPRNMPKAPKASTPKWKTVATNKRRSLNPTAFLPPERRCEVGLSDRRPPVQAPASRASGLFPPTRPSVA
jgi:hypothetical protein